MPYDDCYMYVTCYLWLSICYLLSESFYLKLAITCKKLVSFRSCCMSRNFFHIYKKLFYILAQNKRPPSENVELQRKISFKKAWSPTWNLYFKKTLSLKSGVFQELSLIIMHLVSYENSSVVVQGHSCIIWNAAPHFKNLKRILNFLPDGICHFSDFSWFTSFWKKYSAMF